MAKIKIKDFIEENLRDFLVENGYELYHTEFIKEGKDWFLRVYVDNSGHNKGNISTGDCEKVSRYLSEVLDKEEPIEQNYYLEVSSPGMDRQLYTDKHMERYIGRKVEVSLYKKFDNSKNIEGILKAFDEEKVTVSVDDNDILIDRVLISKINLAVVM